MKFRQYFLFIPVNLVLLLALTCSPVGVSGAPLAATPAAVAPVDITGPVGSGAFGSQALVLPNGNLVVSDPSYDMGGKENVGAVYLYDGRTLVLISTLTGNRANDHVGSDIETLTNGNYVISSPAWDNGTSSSAGAVTWCSGTLGCSGAVSPANSLVGSQAEDRVGFSITALSNGSYVVQSPYWAVSPTVMAGAVTWCGGTQGCTGVVSPANSVVGSRYNDRVGSQIEVLTNGNYVINSPAWDNSPLNPDAGAVTWCSGTQVCAGAVSYANSLVGSQTGDQVGLSITALSNGNYVVQSPNWTRGTVSAAGAATWCSGTQGCAGEVRVANSLLGSRAGDRVGSPITALTNGNYVVQSPDWTNGTASAAGAVTWCSGTDGCSGSVGLANSLVGTQENDHVGADIGALTNGNYIVGSQNWANGPVSKVGAVTWCSGTQDCTGVVSEANSLVGSHTNDLVGVSISPLTNGYYVVGSPFWVNGSAVEAGAVTWCSAVQGCAGEVSAANSLVGSRAGDHVGEHIEALSNGNYVVSSSDWTNGTTNAAGVVTWCSGSQGCMGEVTLANNLVGSQENDHVGTEITALTQGNYVVGSFDWAKGTRSAAGAVTWCSGTQGCNGAVSPSNSLVGSHTNDQVGVEIVPLFNGNYVVKSQYWANGLTSSAGAITLGDDLGSLSGPISSANSVLGTVANGGTFLTFSYDDVNDRLAVGLPDENRVTLFPARGIHVFGGDLRIPSGVNIPSSADGSDFGVLRVGKSVIHTFTIANNSEYPLMLTGEPLVSITGSDAADFTVLVEPTPVILGNSTTTFQVRFSPTMEHLRSATVTITSNDLYSSPYTLTVQGIGGSPVHLPIIMR